MVASSGLGYGGGLYSSVGQRSRNCSLLLDTDGSGVVASRTVVVRVEEESWVDG